MTLTIRQQTEISTHHEMLDQKARKYFNNAKAENTKKSYQTDWMDFEGWCRKNNLQSMPADVQTVIRYLTDRASHPWERMVNKRRGRGNDMQIVEVPVLFQPLKPSSIERKISAISKAHQYAGHLFDRKNVILAEVLKGIKREKGTLQEQKTATLIDDIKAMTRNLSGVQGIRDKAIILIGFTCALRRSEIVQLQLNDLKEVEQGFEVTVRFSKTDQGGEGHIKTCPLSHNPETCPVVAIKAWINELKKSGIESGPLFRSIDKYGNIRTKAMCAASVSLIIKRNTYLRETQGNYGAHSLRSGFCTQAALNGVPDSLAMLQSGHKDSNTFKKYVRVADRWKNSAAKKLGL